MLLPLSHVSLSQCRYSNQGRSSFDGYDFKKTEYKKLKSSLLDEALEVSVEKRTFSDSVVYILWLWRDEPMSYRDKVYSLRIRKEDSEIIFALDDKTLVSLRPYQDEKEVTKSVAGSYHYQLSAAFKLNVTDIERLKKNKVIEMRLKVSANYTARDGILDLDVVLKEKFQASISDQLKCL